MEEKNERRAGKQVTDPVWIIRWLDPYGIECRSGPKEEVEAYARKKAQEAGNRYLLL